jgi:hypothetical protein
MLEKPFLRVKASPSATSAIHIVQLQVAGLYNKVIDLKRTDEKQANELIRAIRLLEEEIIDMRKAQPGYCLRIGR